jgi:hypothetical protein
VKCDIIKVKTPAPKWHESASFIAELLTARARSDHPVDRAHTLFHVKHLFFFFGEGGPVDRHAYMGGRAREPSCVNHGLRAGGPNNRHA